MVATEFLDGAFRERGILLELSELIRVMKQCHHTLDRKHGIVSMAKAGVKSRVHTNEVMPATVALPATSNRKDT